MKEKRFVMVLLLIGTLGFFLRVYNLENNPIGFFCDEAFFGYNAYSLLTTWRDENGVILPFFPKTFGEPRLPVPFYMMVPAIAIFGLNEFGARITSVILGTLSIFFFYFMVKQLTNQKVAIFSSLLLSVSGWHIHFSRQATENIFFSSFLIFSLTLFLSKYYFWSILCFAVTLYTYSPAMLVVPIFVFLIHLSYKKYLTKEVLLKGLLIFLVLALPLFYGIASGIMLARWKNGVGITTIEQDPVRLAKRFTKGYLNHFSLDFLFRQGDIDFPGQAVKRYSVRGFGQLYWFQLPLLLAGVVSLRRFPSETAKTLFILFALYPLGSSLTSNVEPWASRSIMGIIPFQILSGCGIWQIYEWVKNNRMLKYMYLAAGGLIILASIVLYQYKFHQEYPKYSADFWGWQYGPKEIISYFESVHDNYDDLFISGAFNSPYIFIKFYSPSDCQRCQVGGLEKLDYARRQLFALRPEEIKLDYSRINIHKIINYPNEDIAFIIFDLKK